MAKEEKYYCDNCGKEVWSQSGCVSIAVYAAQGPRDNFKAWKSEDLWPYWKHRELYNQLLCEKCVGERVTVNHGDDHHFSLSHKAKKFLKKFGFIKKSTQKDKGV